MANTPHSDSDLGTLAGFLAETRKTLGRSWQPVIWLIALALGVLTGYLVLAFRRLIGAVQWLGYGSAQEDLYTTAAALPGWWVALIPVAGGVAVGGLLYLGYRIGALPEKRAYGVADVIEARGILGGKVSSKQGLMSALVSGVSLGSGASTGREGPAVHLGAALASLIARRLNYPPNITRTLLACGAAAAVSASFNAPIAGVLFALEVILGHYALSVFAPIVIASVSSAVVTRLHFGEYPTFLAPPLDMGSYLQIPAFALLGLVAGLVAISFIKSVMFTSNLTEKAFFTLNIPYWAQPALGGVLIGMLGALFPQVLGVGYDATDQALNAGFALQVMILLIAVKIAATSITISCRFGGGVFSPALFLGAMTGGAFGIIASSVTPEYAASISFYAVVGMGAVSAAILGAPISTTLIGFELVREYEVAVALMVSVSIATMITQAVLGKSFFHWQIEMRGYKLREGPHQALLHTMQVRDVMQSNIENAPALSEDRPALRPTDRLRTVFDLMDTHQFDTLSVIDLQNDQEIIGVVTRLGALRAYNHALIEANIESHR